ncbi:unnamed protein product [Mycetohabitans rhizoxinica HKI 454]|uniref:Uncharacterized protein n=1 Tax=Mycetohabitans rhizoxinica (strain DSM 19002 / CIP 109453 / HKI 454) TaxID=882378 RepID=E5AQM5_MYCRK|nr:unnamed protein product [Mycetohabitans rhizoxinica HKI 454]
MWLLSLLLLYVRVSMMIGRPLRYFGEGRPGHARHAFGSGLTGSASTGAMHAAMQLDEANPTNRRPRLTNSRSHR